MKMLSLAVVAMGALALPFGAQALSVSVVFDASREADLNWSEHVQAGLALTRKRGRYSGFGPRRLFGAR